MIGVVSLIQIARTSANQVADIRRTQGQPAIAERLIHDQMEAILAPVGAPNPAPVVPPIGQCAGPGSRDCTTYEAVAAKTSGCNIGGLQCYTISVRLQGKDFTAATSVAPPVRVWRP